MADVTMTPNERDNINSILEIAKDLPAEEQQKLYYIGVGLAYSNKEKKDDSSNQ